MLISSLKVWSFGIIIYELLSGKISPTPNSKPEKPKKPENAHQYPLLSSIFDACLQEDPANRPTATDLLKMFSQHKSN